MVMGPTSRQCAVVSLRGGPLRGEGDPGYPQRLPLPNSPEQLTVLCWISLSDPSALWVRQSDLLGILE